MCWIYDCLGAPQNSLTENPDIFLDYCLNLIPHNVSFVGTDDKAKDETLSLLAWEILEKFSA